VGFQEQTKYFVFKNSLA